MNIANILKNCPECIELYSPVCGEVIFIRVCSNNNITVREPNGSLRYFLPDGKYTENGECVLFPSKEQRDWNKFIPDFKVGDVITDGNINMKITSIKEGYYYGYDIRRGNDNCTFPLNCTHKYKIYKFDPKTLKHYDKVLVRRHKESIWYPTLVSYVSNSGKVFVLDMDHAVDQIIPYEGNTHLVEKTDDPEECYISWQE